MWENNENNEKSLNVLLYPNCQCVSPFSLSLCVTHTQTDRSTFIHFVHLWDVKDSLPYSLFKALSVLFSETAVSEVL